MIIKRKEKEILIKDNHYRIIQSIFGKKRVRLD